MIYTRPTLLTLAWASGRALMSNPGVTFDFLNAGAAFRSLKVMKIKNFICKYCALTVSCHLLFFFTLPRLSALQELLSVDP